MAHGLRAQDSGLGTSKRLRPFIRIPVIRVMKVASFVRSKTSVGTEGDEMSSFVNGRECHGVSFVG